MPEKDGIEVLKEIKSFDSKAKVVMLSSSGTRSHLKSAIEAGAIDFIQKPWDSAQLSSVISRITQEGEGV
jgi:two-component system chemotaxis response regulator CheY